MPEDEQGLDKLEEEASQAAEEANGREVTSDSWAMYSYGDGPAAAGGGVGCFLFFDSREQMLEFIGRHLVYESPGPSAVAPLPVAEAVRAIVETAGNQQESREQLIGKLNEALRHFSQIVWWGPMREVLSSNAEFPRKMRSFVLELDDETNEVPAVAQDDLDDFVERLRVYGL